MIQLSDAIKLQLNARLDHLHTAFPATIVSYDANTQKASVQPMIERLDSNGESTKPAVINGVPILFPSAGTGILSFPIKTGDHVLVVVSDRSLDNYMFSDGSITINPEDRKTHDISDAIAIPGLYPYQLARGINVENVVLRMNATANNAQNPGENSLHLLPIGKTEAIILHANQYNGNHSVIKILQNGDIHLDTLQGTNIQLTQAGDVTVNTPTKVVVNSGGNTEVNAGGDCTIVADGNVNLKGSGGGAIGGVISSLSINELTGLPFADPSSNVFNTKG
jgi:Phage protein Gp138 N-terminal domain